MSREDLLNIFGVTLDRAGNVLSMAVVFWALAHAVPLETFGVFVFFYSIMTVFLAISQYGLNEILVKEIVLKREKEAAYIVGGWTVRFALAALLALPFYLSLDVLIGNQVLVKQMIFPFSLILLFKSADVFKAAYESRSQTRIFSFPQALVQTVFCAAKLIVVLQTKDIVLLAWIMCLEFACLALLFFLLYRWNNALGFKLEVIGNICKDLLKQGFPLAISALAVVVYLRVDQVMVGALLGDKELGLYTPAVMISEVWYMVPTILVSALFPRIMHQFENNKADFIQKSHRLLCMITYLSLAFLIFVLVFAEILLTKIFGEVFADSVIALQVYIFSALFVAHGLVSSRMLMLESLSNLIWMRTFFGMITNILLNFLFIPTHGIVGAALATSISYFLVVVFTLLDRRALYICRIMVYSIHPTLPQVKKTL